MTVWRYEAVALDRSSNASISGVIPAAARTDARAALRRIGLQPIVLEPLATGTAAGLLGRMTGAADRLGVLPALTAVMRSLRLSARTELADSIASMLDAGMTLAEALATAQRASRGRSLKTVLATIGQEVASGGGLTASMEAHDGWFDAAERALIGAGLRSGELARSWRRIGLRLERRGHTTGRLIGVTAYPALVLCVSLVVVGFLGTRTLPELTRILDDSGIATPRLTVWAMVVGSFVATWGWAALISAFAGGVLVLRIASARTPRVLARLRPRFVVALRVSRAARAVSDLLDSGIPLADSLRIAAPTAGRSLGGALHVAADGVERGAELAEAFGDSQWFDAEAIRVLTLAQATGDLAPALSRLADRLERRAQRTIEGLSRAAEPALILALAVIVGTIVLAAILPLIKLQEVL